MIEKNGKTLHLLKASAKKINPSKKRKIIPLLGSIKDFHAADEKQKEEVKQEENPNQQNFTIGVTNEEEDEENSMQ